MKCVYTILAVLLLTSCDLFNGSDDDTVDSPSTEEPTDLTLHWNDNTWNEFNWKE